MYPYTDGAGPCIHMHEPDAYSYAFQPERRQGSHTHNSHNPTPSHTPASFPAPPSTTYEKCIEHVDRAMVADTPVAFGYDFRCCIMRTYMLLACVTCVCGS